MELAVLVSRSGMSARALLEEPDVTEDLIDVLDAAEAAKRERDQKVAFHQSVDARFAAAVGRARR